MSHPGSPFSDATTARPLTGVDAASVARRSVRVDLDEDHRRANEKWGHVDAELRKAQRSRTVISAVETASPVAATKASGPELRVMAHSASAPATTSKNLPRYMTVGKRRGEDDEDDAMWDGCVPPDRYGEIREKRENKLKQMKIRSGETSVQLKDHNKKRLRLKIGDICTEIAHRKKLQELQKTARKFREQRMRMGVGSWPELGDHTEDALGLLQLTGDPTNEMVQSVASPRRACILETLSMVELDMLRRDSRYYFVGAFEPSEESKETGSTKEVVNSVEDEELIDFFTPSRQDKDITVEQYAERLRKKLSPGLVRHEHSSTSPTFAKPLVDSASLEPLEMMPCMGAKKGVRNDMESPTLCRVREAYYRRNIADAKLIKDRQEAMTRRERLNAFKAKEQQRELQLQVFKQKELHKVRMLEAEERKMLQDAEEEDRLQILEAQKAEQNARNVLRAEKAINEKRQRATEKVEDWERKFYQADHRKQYAEIARMREAEQNWDSYLTRLWKIGLDKHTSITSQAEKNDALRKQIQSSLVQQIADHQKEESRKLQQEIEQKQADAKRRREMLSGCRYNFLEKAFGKEAIGLDIKHHVSAVDRRCDSWIKSSEAWAKERGNFSSPNLRTSA